MRSGYRKLNDLIEVVDVRNTAGDVDTLIGLSIDKCFISSVANTVGTDLTKYKIIQKNEFAVSLMQISRDEKVPVACQKDYNVAIISPAYVIFRVKNPEEIIPDYLSLWFMRQEFDREASFLAVGGVRGSMPWEDFCRMKLPVPPYDEQLRIVSRFNSVSHRIEILQKTNDNLIEFAKIILRKKYECEDSFYDNISTLNSFCKTITSGGTPNRGNHKYWHPNDINWLKNGEIKNNIIVNTEESISKLGFSESSTKLIPANSVSMAMYCVSDIQVSFNTIPLCTNQAVINLITDDLKKSIFLYYLLMIFGNYITTQANGSA